MKQSKKKQLKVLITFSALIALSLGVFVFLYVQSSKNTIVVPIVTAKIGEGVKFEKDVNYATTEIGNLGLSPTMIKLSEDVEGKYALRDFNPDEYIFSDSVSNTYERRLPEKLRFGGVSVRTSLIESGGAELKPDDFVRATIIISDKDQESEGNMASDKLPTQDTAIVKAKELGAIRIMGIFDSSGKSISSIYDANSKKLEEGLTEAEKTSLSPSYITFDATEAQEALLLQANYSGKLHLTILPEKEQNEYRKQWGIVLEEGVKEVKKENDIIVAEDEVKEESTEEIQDAE